MERKTNESARSSRGGAPLGLRRRRGSIERRLLLLRPARTAPPMCPGDVRYVKPPNDLIVMLSLLIMAKSSAKAYAPSPATQPAAAALLRAIFFALFATP
jgi:hypothetical protein